MDDGIESHDACQRTVGKGQGQHIAMNELDVCVPLAGFPNQLGRKIKTSNADAESVEECRRLAWTAPEVVNLSASSYFVGKTAQQLAVQGLVREFVSEPLRVLPGDYV